jgi:long-chain fatty acid transport protein
MMKRDARLWLGMFMCILLLPAVAFGNGYLINEIETKSFSMGGAFVAQADTPAAVYFNPAGMSQLDGTQVSAGFSVIMPSGTFESNGTTAFGQAGQSTDFEDQTFFVPNAFVTHKFNDKWSLGIGGVANFGLATEWDEGWEGRFITGGTKAELTTFSANPTVSFRPTEKFAIGAGLVGQYLDITLENKRFLGMGVPEADVSLTGDNWEWGFNLGLLFFITDELKLGASYRSRIKHEIDGITKIKGLSRVGLPDVEMDSSADLELPDIGYLGLAWSRGPLTLEADAQWTGWSSYDELAVVFDQPILGNPGTTSPKDWKDVWAYRFGAEYRLTDTFSLRGGIVYDESPIPDETLDVLVPSGDRWLYAIGLGYDKGNFGIDFGYNYLVDEDREFVNDVGNYNETIAPGLGNMTGEFVDGSSHLFMLNLIFRF